MSGLVLAGWGGLTPCLADPVVAFAVYGTPAPQGSKTARVVRGRAVMRESSAKVKPWRALVVSAATDALDALDPWVPLDGPLVASVVFTMPKPKGAPKTRRTWPAVTPDLDKLLRSTGDALTEAGVWADDARVVEYVRAAKVYPNEDPDALRSPGAVIRVGRLSEAAAGPVGSSLSHAPFSSLESS